MTARRRFTRRPLACLLAFAFAATLTLAAPLAAQRGGGGGSTPGGVAVSPDGTQVAWVVRSRDGISLHLAPVADASKETLIAPPGVTGCYSNSAIWSPDSKTLAFTSTCTAEHATRPDQEQIFLRSLATGETRQLTHVTGLFKQSAWSPDGKSIAFLFVENATRSAGALDAMKPWSGVIGEDGVEIQRVAAVEVSSGAFRFLTQPKIHVYEFAWAPNAKEFAYIGANPPGENTWWIAKLYVKNAGSGGPNAQAAARAAACPTPTKSGEFCNYGDDSDIALPRVLLDPVTVPGPLHGLQIAVPRYSPDGKHIAFIGGLMSDQGSTGGDVWVIPSTGGTPTDITPNIDGTPTFLAWTGNDGIGFTEERRGHLLLAAYGLDDHKQHDVIDLGQSAMSGGSIKDAVSVSDHGLLGYAMSSVGVPAEVYVGPFGPPKAFTQLNTAAPKPSARFESIEWKSSISGHGGPDFDVQGWLTYPANYDPAKKYPMIVQVHGGPSASAGPRPDTQFSNLGYFVLAPNPRGSFGQGEAFVQANIKDFGYGDLRDILAGVDAVEKKVSIDDHRLGLTGWSYGGFMSMFAETQTHRFAAIVAGAGISNWQSYYGENSIDQWMVPFFGATVYDDPAIYARSSAINYIKNAKTPMLIIVGDRDGECPAPQSFEMWHALKAVGVKTQLVIYPNEGHGFRDPAHIRDRNERTVKWFAENMPEGR